MILPLVATSSFSNLKPNGIGVPTIVGRCRVGDVVDRERLPPGHDHVASCPLKKLAPVAVPTSKGTNVDVLDVVGRDTAGDPDPRARPASRSPATGPRLR